VDLKTRTAILLEVEGDRIDDRSSDALEHELTSADGPILVEQSDLDAAKSTRLDHRNQARLDQ
jgi:hypothetical protein